MGFYCTKAACRIRSLLLGLMVCLPACDGGQAPPEPPSDDGSVRLGRHGRRHGQSTDLSPEEEQAYKERFQELQHRMGALSGQLSRVESELVNLETGVEAATGDERAALEQQRAEKASEKGALVQERDEVARELEPLTALRARYHWQLAAGGRPAPPPGLNKAASAKGPGGQPGGTAPGSGVEAGLGGGAEAGAARVAHALANTQAEVAYTALGDTTSPMLFVAIQGGDFTMGSPTGVGYAYEQPEHQVQLAPCLLAVTETTLGQWKQLMEVPGTLSASDDDQPMEFVSWCDALRFANALSQREGLATVYTLGEDCEQGGEVRWDAAVRGFRLPTEAEWEHAARGGTRTVYWSGDEASDLQRVGWTLENSGNKLHVVGSKDPNPWGLVDVHGNVWEWVWDRYGAYDAEAAVNPLGATTGADRVVRGGCAWNDGSLARSAFRYWRSPDVRHPGQGFRLALPVGPAVP